MIDFMSSMTSYCGTSLCGWDVHCPFYSNRRLAWEPEAKLAARCKLYLTKKEDVLMMGSDPDAIDCITELDASCAQRVVLMAC